MKSTSTPSQQDLENTRAFEKLKQAQKDSWSHFHKLEQITIPPAALLVDFAKIAQGAKVLDVACGTGVVGITAAAQGAEVSGIDFAPLLIEKARENARIAERAVDFKIADVENIPFADATFDVVLSQFGHMFSPRPDRALSEMLRVLKPGGCIAFSTWPEELFVGSAFSLFWQQLPPPELELPSPLLWGDPKIIVARFGERVADIRFDRRINRPGFLSVKHAREVFEATISTFCTQLAVDAPAQLVQFRRDYEALIARYMRGNTLEQHFLMTRARKK